MFCKNCGTENEDTAKVCKSCGQSMETEDNTERSKVEEKADVKPEDTKPADVKPAASADSKPAASKPLDKTTALILAVVGGGFVLIIALLLLVFAIATAKPTIKLDNYLTIETSGYDGYGTATVVIDWDGIEEKYGKKLSLTNRAKKEIFWLTPMDYLKSGIHVNLENQRELSNGDIIAYTWEVDENLFDYVKCKTKYSDDSYTVEGLTEVGTFDAFADLEVTFSGISPNASLTYDYSGSQLSRYDFRCDTQNGLKNGDTITISIDNRGADYYIKNWGMIPSGFEKEYVVSGLDEYADAYEKIPADFIAGLKSEAEDTIYAYTASYYNSTSSLTNLTYAGYAFNRVKDEGENYYRNGYNNLYVIYSGTVSSSDGSFSTSKVYFPVKFKNILSSEAGLSYETNEGIFGNTGLDGRYNTSGYRNPLTCYIEIVEAQRDAYTSECGDGFEAYAEYDQIAKLDDISKEYKEILYADARDKIESYIATSYNGGSEASDLEVFGEYLLLAKTQGTDFANNNRYIIVFSATASNSEGRFDTTTVYFPVEYDGIVKLPGGEYMVTTTKGLDNNQSQFPGSFYSTRGYLDGSQMYSKLVTANRNNYTYEVSGDLQQFGD